MLQSQPGRMKFRLLEPYRENYNLMENTYVGSVSIGVGVAVGIGIDAWEEYSIPIPIPTPIPTCLRARTGR